MENTFKISGKIVFDPVDYTSKQKRQSEWKKVAMIMLEPDLKPGDKGITEYYAWFIKKRFGIHLQKPLRDGHVTIVNDRVPDDKDFTKKWEEAKRKWEGKKIEVVLHVDPFLGVKNRKGNYTDWWLVVPYEDREEIHSIRKELGLKDRSFFGLHMTIGTAVNFRGVPYFKGVGNAVGAMLMNEEESERIIKLAQDGYFDKE